MQWTALTENGISVSAKEAKARLDYYCPECQTKVRLKSGLYRRPHFFHVESSRSCKMSGKSPEHLQVQLYLQKLIGKENLILEHPFPSIGRIADTFWVKENLVFEVQCSPITKTEVQERNRDYAALGLQVVWILHDDRFNRTKFSEAEIFLRGAPHYFTNIDHSGKGCIYDQTSTMMRGVRLDQSIKYVFEPTEIRRGLNRLSHRLSWPLSFKGDATESKSKQKKESLLLTWLDKLIVTPYDILFGYFFEKNINNR